MPSKPILFYSHKCQHSVKLINSMKQGGTLNSCVCINVSKPYKFKIPPQIRSVPTIMTQNGQVLTGSFVQNFVSTVLPQLSGAKSSPTSSNSNMNSMDPGPRPSIPSNDRKRPPPSVSPTSKVSADLIAKQQYENQQGGGLQSANFGTEFSTFSYLPGSNDLQETFQDFEYLNHGGSKMTTQEKNVSNISRKAMDVQNKLEAMQAARSEDMRRAGGMRIG